MLGLRSVPAAEASQAATERAVSRSEPQRVEAGKKLFAASCGFCHGAEGKGAAAPGFRNRSLTAVDVTSVISNGKPGTTMPAFKNTYSQEQVADLVAYILSLSTSGATEAAESGTPTAATPVAGSAANGADIYAKSCASCHEAGGPPYLNHYVMKAAAPEYIVHMLAAGVMHAQGARLTAPQRAAVAEYITGRPLASSGLAATSAGRCSGPVPKDFSGPQWNGWGVDLENSRFQRADAAGLTVAQIPNLKLKWAFGFPGGFAAFSQPVVAGGRVYVGGPLGGVYSLDASTGCTYWSFQADAGVRTAVTIGPGHLAYFGDLRANVYAVDAVTGKLVWKTRVSDHPYARVTGAPRLYKGRLYVPVASREEWMAADPRYECCTFRGMMVALDAATGKQVWRSYTIPDPPQPTKKAENGAQRWGPSGAALWSSPTVDTQRQLLYIGASNNYSDPHTFNSDAILAFDLKTGKIVWSHQITAEDTYNISCLRDDKSNCPEKSGPDYDFGASPTLRTLANGQRVLIISQKSGVVYGLDPDKEGQLLWQTRIGKGGALGGIEWGPAADSKLVYEALSDLEFGGGPEGTIPDPKAGGGLFALQIATGEKVWEALPAPGGCTTPRCSPAQSAAVTAIPGVVFSGADDGHFRAYSSTDGKILWDYNTAREFDTVNKVPARGGSIDGTGSAVAGGMVFVDSGYGALFGMPGNVLLAFGPE